MNYRNYSADTEDVCNETGIVNRLPVVLLLLLVLFVGVIGNGLVFTTSTLKPKRTSSSQFILHLAIYDIIACVTVIPVALVGLLQRSAIQYNIICKLFMFLCLLLALSSLLTLDLVAVDRFLKICRPLSRGISYRSSRRLFMLEVITGLVFALATLFFQGVSHITEDYSSAYCYRGICLLNNDFYSSEYRHIFNILMFIILGAMFLVLIVCYVLVIKAILRRRTRYQKTPTVTVTRPPSTSDQQLLQNVSRNSACADSLCPDNLQDSSACDSRQSTSLTTYSVDTLSTSEERRQLSNDVTSEVYEDSHSPNIIVVMTNQNRRMNASRSARILFVVTVTFLLCWLPTWILGCLVRLHLHSAEQFLGWSNTKNNAVIFMEYWYLTNHAVNPVIYAFMDQSFRSDCLKIFLHLRFYMSRKHNDG